MSQKLKSPNPPIRQLRGIGTVVEKKMQRHGIQTLMDLLCWLPDLYVDPASVTPAEKLGKLKGISQHPMHVVGQIRYADQCFATTSNQTWFEVHLGGPGSQPVKGVWPTFDPKEMEYFVRLGHWVLLSAPVADHKMTSPKILPLGADYPWPLTKQATTRYPAVYGIAHRFLKKTIFNIVSLYGSRLDSQIDKDEISSMELMMPSEAFRKLHLDWPCEEVTALNNRETIAHKTVHYLRSKIPTS